ncbi:MAG: glycoside hydrolase family 92 protein, partial [Burkholderiales bacterium]|nr:glycoside hydrolase family 92 protein [Opitutaceae bacterium]
RIEIDPATSDAHKRMFYTGLYHTMLMPVDRTGENPLWKSDQPAYDDFYAIWDTYRSSHPLITLIDPKRQVDIVNSLLDIYRYDGYMPDARSGNSNGRTQGGSNAEVLIADAYVKGLPGIDYKVALQAMLKDADVPPGGNEEQEGRGGLPDYNTLGYVSTRYPRSGTRTVEYAFNDFCIAIVAQGLGEKALFERFAKQAGNWKNLWRADFKHQGATGFILPKDADGKWLDFVKVTVPAMAKEIVPVDPTYVNSGKYEEWWSGFLYEANSWEYSLSIPHDVAGLIEKSGGPEAFKTRLDTLFAKRYYYVGNEPSFLSPNLYHWIGRQDLSSDCIHSIVNRAYKDTRRGIPGNDDSGSMSSWLVFRMLGFYPNAGQSYYLLSTPFVAASTLHQTNGKDFRVVAKNLSATNKYITAATLDGKPLARAWIEHAEIVQGGVLELEMSAQANDWGRANPPPSLRFGAE